MILSSASQTPHGSTPQQALSCVGSAGEESREIGRIHGPQLPAQGGRRLANSPLATAPPTATVTWRKEQGTPPYSLGPGGLVPSAGRRLTAVGGQVFEWMDASVRGSIQASNRNAMPQLVSGLSTHPRPYRARYLPGAAALECPYLTRAKGEARAEKALQREVYGNAFPVHRNKPDCWMSQDISWSISSDRRKENTSALAGRSCYRLLLCC
ncbi:hypothetical protein BDZ91DRAFT_718452 [Kalaharituber pfeilii]|nr:hypothetical protein BDZ91DRAFT_718452 [Kalaharituber pfeilii]